jgi:hypothetical protein
MELANLNRWSATPCTSFTVTVFNIFGHSTDEQMFRVNTQSDITGMADTFFTRYTFAKFYFFCDTVDTQNNSTYTYLPITVRVRRSRPNQASVFIPAAIFAQNANYFIRVYLQAVCPSAGSAPWAT